MTLQGWVAIIALCALVLATAAPLGSYMSRIFTPTGKTPLLERGLYRLYGVRDVTGQNWLSYCGALLAFNATGFVLLYVILRLQFFLPLNPQGFSGLSPHLAFNVAVSFITNTNWQSYAGETTVSHFAQMVGLTVQNFVSAATGIAAALALTRAFAGNGQQSLGNFWQDLTRGTLYVLLPLAVVFALVFVALDVPQNLLGSTTVQTVEGTQQTIAQGPVASQLAIKQLGTNGGGFFNANSAHPFENPNIWTNILSLWAIVGLAVGMAVMFGKMVGRPRDGWALATVMMLFMCVASGLIYWAESQSTSTLTALGATGGNMEGKEVRFDTVWSSLYAAFTTGASNGAVNAMHDSFTPLGGLVPLFLIQLGEVLPGGVGSGLYGILLFALLAVFVAGLMVGRSPEYLGKKIEAREIKLVMLAVLILPFVILSFTAVSAVMPSALASLNNTGPHGLSELLYAYSSAAGNNGSAFAGLNANTPWFNTTLGIAMLLGRFCILVPVLAIAGSLAAKRRVAASSGTFPTDGLLFIALLSAIILILGGLQFFPSLVLGPVAEHFQMLNGKLW